MRVLVINPFKIQSSHIQPITRTMHTVSCLVFAMQQEPQESSREGSQGEKDETNDVALHVSWPIFGLVNLRTKHTKALSNHTDHSNRNRTLCVAQLIVGDPRKGEGDNRVDAASNQDCSRVP